MFNRLKFDIDDADFFWWIAMDYLLNSGNCRRLKCSFKNFITVFVYVETVSQFYSNMKIGFFQKTEGIKDYGNIKNKKNWNYATKLRFINFVAFWNRKMVPWVRLQTPEKRASEAGKSKFWINPSKMAVIAYSSKLLATYHFDLVMWEIINRESNRYTNIIQLVSKAFRYDNVIFQFSALHIVTYEYNSHTVPEFALC